MVPYRKKNGEFKVGSKSLGKWISGPDRHLSLISQNDQTLSGFMDLLSKPKGDTQRGPTQEPSLGRWTAPLDPWAVLDNQTWSENTPTLHIANVVGDALASLLCKQWIASPSDQLPLSLSAFRYSSCPLPGLSSCLNPPRKPSLHNLVSSSQPITPLWVFLDFSPNCPF